MTDTENILAQLFALQGKQLAAETQIQDLIGQQNGILAAVPSRRYLRVVNALAVVVLVVTLLVIGYTLHNNIKSTQLVGEQNHETVAAYCAVDPKLPECALKGSDTTKATAILTNCRVFAVLKAVTPVSKQADFPTNAPCAALGF